MSETEGHALGLQSATFQAARAFYTAHSYLAADKPAEAAALYERVQQRVKDALSVWDDIEHPDASLLAGLEALASRAKVSLAATGRLTPEISKVLQEGHGNVFLLACSFTSISVAGQ